MRCFNSAGAAQRSRTQGPNLVAAGHQASDTGSLEPVHGIRFAMTEAIYVQFGRDPFNWTSTVQVIMHHSTPTRRAVSLLNDPIHSFVPLNCLIVVSEVSRPEGVYWFGGWGNIARPLLWQANRRDRDLGALGPLRS